ncbi:MAG: TolC family protein [Bacteroidota bacterium]
MSVPRYFYIFLFVSTYFWQSHLMAQDNTSDPLPQYLELAAKNNPGLKSKFNDYLAAMEEIPQAESLPDPTLAFNIFVQPVETRVGPQRVSLAVSQSFPWFGTLKAQGDVAATMAEAKLKAFENEKVKLYKEVRMTYNQLYYLDKSILLTEENLKLLASFKELARVNFESGKTGFVNVLRVEMEEEELRVKLAALKDRQSASLVAFENLLNQPLSEPITFPETLPTEALPDDKQALYDNIVAQNLKLQELQYQSTAQDDAMQLAQLKSKPSFTVGASYINTGERSDIELPDNGQDAFVFPQIGLSIPLYRKKYQAMSKQASLRKESIQFQMEEKTNNLATQLEMFITDHLDAQRRLQLYARLYDLSERSLSLLQTEFTTGKTDFEELLRMERKLLSYQLELEKARVDNNDAVYNINYLLGK